MTKWTIPEHRILREKYMHAPQEELEQLLPHHAWKQIRLRARRLGLIRKSRRSDGWGDKSSHPITSQFIALRIQKDMSVVALAEAIGISPSVVFRWERGRHLPGLESLQKWAEGLDAHIEVVPNGARTGVDEGKEAGTRKPHHAPAQPCAAPR